MNILIVILAILVIWRGWRGMRTGLVDEIGKLLSLVISLFILSLGILLYTSVKDSDTKNIVLSVIMIILTGIAAKLVNLVMKSLSTIAHLPIINILNSLLGIVIGVAEVVVVLWIIYVVIANFDTGEFGRLMMEWTLQNEVLYKVYEMNQIANWMAAGL